MTVTANDTITLTLGKLTVELEVVAQGSDTLTGSITLPKHSAGMRFTWKRSQYAVPYVWGVYGQKTESRDKAKEFAGLVLRAWADEVISDQGGVTIGQGGDVDPNFVSQLLVNAHVRRPCVVHHGNGSKFLRKATVVNPLKLSAEELTEANRTVKRWNMLVELYRQEFGGNIGNFADWLSARGV